MGAYGYLISLLYPLVMTNIAIENGSLAVDLPIPNGDFDS